MELMMDEQELSLFNELNDTRTSLSEPISLKVIVPLTVIYVTIFVTGILGNIATCIVIGYNRFMHTSTIFLLLNISLSDLLLLICGLPYEIYRIWNPRPVELLCISIELISETSANATVWIIVAFTLEQYLAICRPFMFHRLPKLYIVRYIIGIWLCALCFAVLQVMQFGVTYDEKGQMLNTCTVKGKGYKLVFFIFSFVCFVLPMSLIIILYVLINIKLFTSRVLQPVNKSSVQCGGRSNGTLRYRSGTSQRKVIRMLVAVALSFFLCRAPFHVQRMIAIYGKNLEQPTNIFYKIYVVLSYLSGVLYYLSTSINPILYSIMSNKFRDAFKVTLTSWCSRRDRSRLERTESAVLASQRQRAAARALQHTPHPRSLYRTNLAVVDEELESWPCRQRLAQGSDRNQPSPQSISNSSLREVDQELNSEELATYLYQVDCKIIGKTCETTV